MLVQVTRTPVIARQSGQFGIVEEWEYIVDAMCIRHHTPTELSDISDHVANLAQAEWWTLIMVEGEDATDVNVDM